MLSIDEAKWDKIDKETEVAKIGKYRFIRPINSKTIPLDCPSCKKLLNNVDDIESVKNNDVCEEEGGRREDVGWGAREMGG